VISWLKKRFELSNAVVSLRGAAAAESALLAASVNAGNEPLVRAVICAGLFPNVAVTEVGGGRFCVSPLPYIRCIRLSQKSLSSKQTHQLITRRVNENEYHPYILARHGAGSKPGGYGAQNRVSVRTKGDGEVSLHPTSICFNVQSFEHRFLLFHEKMRTTKVYIRDATMVGPYPLLLFGGKVKVDHERAMATCDNWIHFRAAPRVAVLFKVWTDRCFVFCLYGVENTN
jgi:ATP-dependent RNA helicase DHX36